MDFINKFMRTIDSVAPIKKVQEKFKFYTFEALPKILKSQRYTNADLKICQYLRLHMKIIS